MKVDRFSRAKKRRSARRWLIVLAAVVVLMIIGFVVWIVWFSSWLAVNKVTVSGQTSLKAEKVITKADVSGGMPLARVDTTAIESRVSQLSRVERVHVSRGWPHTVRVRVHERTAIAWTKVDGKVRAIDRHGVDFRGFSKPPKDLVQLKVPADEASQLDSEQGSQQGAQDESRRRESLRACAAVVQSLRDHDKDFLEKISSVSASSKDSVEFTIGRGRSVRWGSPGEVLDKLRVLRVMLDTVKAAHYDVSAPARPTTRK